MGCGPQMLRHQLSYLIIFIQKVACAIYLLPIATARRWRHSVCI